MQKLIGKRILTISSPAETNFTAEVPDSMFNIYIKCDNFNVEIACEDIVAKFYDTVEDGGCFKIFEPSQLEKCQSEKTINRVVKGVSLVIDTVEIEESNYRITYPQAIIIHFDDCNLLIEKYWLFSLIGFVVRLESLDAENFGLHDNYFSGMIQMKMKSRRNLYRLSNSYKKKDPRRNFVEDLFYFRKTFQTGFYYLRRKFSKTQKRY